MDNLIDDLLRGLFYLVSDLCLLAVVLAVLGVAGYYVIVEPYRNQEYELLAFEAVLFLASCSVYRRARDWYEIRKYTR